MKPPLLLHYYITLRCNCSCRFCNIQAPIDAEYEQVVENLKNARKMRIPFVDFTGGEPLLHVKLPDMLKQAKKLGYRTSVTTNALLYPIRARELRGLVDYFHISLDSLDPEQHNSIRGCPIYEQVMQSIDIARSLDEHPDILYTVTPQNIDQLQKLARFARKLGLVLIVNPVFSEQKSLKLSPAHLDQIEQYAADPFVYINKAFHRLRRNGGNHIRAPRCRVMDAVIVISPDNHLVLPCFHYAQIKLQITDGLKELLHQPFWHYYHKKQGRLSVCQGCDLNCYFDPSFHYSLDAFFRESITAKIRYTWYKLKQQIQSFETIPAEQIAHEIRKKSLTFNHT